MIGVYRGQERCEWNKQKGFAQAKVIYSFGRRDQLDVEALRLADAIMDRVVYNAYRIERKVYEKKTKILDSIRPLS